MRIQLTVALVALLASRGGALDALPQIVESDDVSVESVTEAGDGSAWLAGKLGQDASLIVAGNTVEPVRSSQRAFVLKLTPSASYVGSLTIEHSGLDGDVIPRALSVSPSSPTVFLSGTFSGTSSLKLRQKNNELASLDNTGSSALNDSDAFVLQLRDFPDGSGIDIVTLDSNDPAFLQVGGNLTEDIVGLATGGSEGHAWVAVSFFSDSILDGNVSSASPRSPSPRRELVLFSVDPATMIPSNVVHLWNQNATNTEGDLNKPCSSCVALSSSSVHLVLNLYKGGELHVVNATDGGTEQDFSFNSTQDADPVASIILSLSQSTAAVESVSYLKNDDPFGYVEGVSAAHAADAGGLIFAANSLNSLSIRSESPALEASNEDQGSFNVTRSFLEGIFATRIEFDGRVAAARSFKVTNASAGNKCRVREIVSRSGGASEVWLLGRYDAPGIDFGNGVEMLHPLISDLNNSDISETGFVAKLSEEDLSAQDVLSMGGQKLDSVTSIDAGSQTWIAGYSDSVAVAFGDDGQAVQRSTKDSEEPLGFVAALNCASGERLFTLLHSALNSSDAPEKAENLSVDVLRGKRCDGKLVSERLQVDTGKVRSLCLSEAGEYCVRTSNDRVISDGMRLAFRLRGSCEIAVVPAGQSFASGFTQRCGIFGDDGSFGDSSSEAQQVIDVLVTMQGYSLATLSTSPTTESAVKSFLAFELKLSLGQVQYLRQRLTQDGPDDVVATVKVNVSTERRESAIDTLLSIEDSYLLDRLTSLGLNRLESASIGIPAYETSANGSGGSVLSDASLAGILVCVIFMLAIAIICAYVYLRRRRFARIRGYEDDEQLLHDGSSAELGPAIRKLVHECATADIPIDDDGTLFVRGSPRQAVLEIADAVLVKVSRTSDGKASTVKIAEDADLLMREAEMIERAQSNHIVSIWGIVTVQDHQCVEMEPVTSTGKHELDKARHSEEKARRMMQALLSGLRNLHHQGLVHGNIRVESLYRCGNRWKLADLGNAIEADQEIELVLEAQYTPPEAAEMWKQGSTKLSQTTDADLWSAGVVAHQLVSGDLYFEQLENEELVNALVKWDVTRDAMLPTGRIGFLASQLLQYDPLERPRASKALKLIRSNEDISTADDVDLGLEYVLPLIPKENMSDSTSSTLSQRVVLVSMILQEMHSWKKVVDAPMQASKNSAQPDEPVFLIAPGRKYQVFVTLGLGSEAASQLAKIRRITMRTRDGPTSVLKPELVGKKGETLKMQAIWDLGTHGGTLYSSSRADAGTIVGLHMCVHCEQVDGRRVRMEVEVDLKVWYPSELDPGEPFTRDQSVWKDSPSWLNQLALGSTNIYRFDMDVEDEELEGDVEKGLQSAPAVSGGARFSRAPV